MISFLTLELPYIFISLFILGIFLFVATRPFVSPLVMKRGLIPLVLFLSLGVGAHYAMTQNRANEVLAAFNNGQTIICSERRDKVGYRNIEVVKGDLWRVEGMYFINSDGMGFLMQQCLVR